MDAVCISCLSTDRRLEQLHQSSLQMSIFKFLLHDEIRTIITETYKLCWECIAKINNLITFRKKAKQSLKVIKKYLINSECFSAIGNHKSLSNLHQSKMLIIGSGDVHNNVSLSHKQQSSSIRVKKDLFKHEFEPQSIFLENNVVTEYNESSTHFEHIPFERIKTENCSEDDFDNNPIEAFTPIASTSNNLNTSKMPSNQLMLSQIAKDPVDKNPMDSESTLSADETEWNSEDNQPLLQEIKKKKPAKTPQSSVKPLYPIVTDFVPTWKQVIVSDKQFEEWRLSDSNSTEYTLPLYKCTTCLVGFWYEDRLQQHNTKCHHESVGSHICGICAQRFPTLDLMKQHVVLHYSLFQCVKCHFNTRLLRRIVQHDKYNHSGIVISCDVCHAVFSTDRQLQSHVETTHRTEFKCHCGEVFNTRSKISMHRFKAHRKLGKVTCPVCNKVLKNKYYLKNHVTQIHHTTEPLYCIPCDKTFKNSGTYRMHFKNSQKHRTPEKQEYQCDHCKRMFVSKDRLKTHISQIHLMQKKLRCKQCPRLYNTRMGLKTHVAKAHDETYVQVKRIVCDVCGKKFLTKAMFEDHMVTHTRLRPHHCKLCPSTFGQKAALYTHNKLVHEKVKKIWPKKKKKPAKTTIEETIAAV